MLFAKIVLEAHLQLILNLQNSFFQLILRIELAPGLVIANPPTPRPDTYAILILSVLIRQLKDEISVLQSNNSSLFLFYASFLFIFYFYVQKFKCSQTRTHYKFVFSHNRSFTKLEQCVLHAINYLKRNTRFNN